MEIQKLILFFLIISFNLYPQDDGPPECMIDCPGLEDIGPDGNPNQICEWIISANGSECMEDCEEEFIIWVEYASDACDNCLSDTTIDCADIFEDDEDLEDECIQFESEDECIAVGCEWGGDDGCYGNWDDDEDHEDGPPECLLDCEGIEYINSEENPYETCDWIISNFGPNNFINPCAEDCDEETMMDINEYMEACFQCLADNNCDDVFGDEEEDDGGWEDFNCEEITNLEECYQVGCEWSTIITPNGVFEMCVDPESNDDGGWNEEGCFENDQWYCWGCELFINDCEYYECTPNGWVGPFENPECNDNNGDGCSDLGEEGCINAPDCEPNYDAAGQFEGCLETNDGPPECLLDCEGIEYVNPEEDPYEACDWIISNFGPNNFFNECAYDCDEETMMIINQIAEVCFICLSDENIDCADVWVDGDENSCSDLTQDECDSVDYCEWIANPQNDFYGCVEIGPGGDDGGTGGGDGCFENGEWYCYGCELFINDCEYYECTAANGWVGPFIIDDCWINCEDLSQYECMDNPNCMWVFDNESNSANEEGYCMEFDDNPPGDELAILKLEHTTGLPGTVVSVPLILYNLETVAGLQFSIEGYNTPNFPGISVESFESTNDCFSASYNEVDEQLIGIIFSIEGCSYPPSEYNHIANILFYIDETAPVGVDVPLWFNYTLVSDTSGNEIPSYGEESHITLGMQGDVNFDGEVNVLDIVAVVNFAIYADEPNGSEFWASDINFDGQINVLDIVQLINIILDI